MMKFLAHSVAAAALALNCLSANAAVYIVAHPDDLTYLMAGNAITDIKGGYPTVVVILTAGDAGNGNMANNPARPTFMRDYNAINNKYYRVRLLAHQEAIKTWLPANYSKTPVVTTEYFDANATLVEKVKIGNVISYYLNLPDGSLPGLYASPLDSLATKLPDVEGINAYNRYSLIETIRQIISRNNKNTPTLAVNYQEPDPDHIEPWYNEAMLVGGQWVIPTDKNPDHADHIEGGKFVRDAINGNSKFWCVGQIIYMGYATTLYDEVQGLRSAHEAGALALSKVLYDQQNWTWNPSLNNETGGMQRGAWDSFHQAFIGRQKFRLYGVPNAGACAF